MKYRIVEETHWCKGDIASYTIEEEGFWDWSPVKHLDGKDLVFNSVSEAKDYLFKQFDKHYNKVSVVFECEIYRPESL